MNKIIKAVPNTLTLVNLISGCIGLLFLIRGDIRGAVYMMWVAAVFDFLDGFAARALKAYSDIGKQLDSLADMISFGVLPSIILFVLISKNSNISFLPPLGLSVAVFSAIRLARFNIDKSESVNFSGIPTPASALLISGLGIWSQCNIGWLNEIGNNPYVLVSAGIILSGLMASAIPFPSLKIKNYSLKSNLLKIFMVLGGLVLLIIFKLNAVAFIFIVYVLVALIKRAFRL